MGIFEFVIGVLFGFVAEHIAVVAGIAAAFAMIVTFRIARKGGLADGFRNGACAYKDAVDQVRVAINRVQSAEDYVTYCEKAAARTRQDNLDEGWDYGLNNQLKGNFSYEHRNWVQQQMIEAEASLTNAKSALAKAKAELAAAREVVESMLS